MTFQQLQYFLEVQRTGSVTKAAKNLFVSYPSVSVAIANIEKELGVVLFTRGPKGLTLTERGEQVLGYANTITKAYTLMTGLRQDGRRSIRINCGDYETISTAFARLVEEYGPDHDAELSMVTYNSEDSFRKLITGEVAVSVLMFMSDTGNQRIRRDGLLGEELARIPLTVCLGEKHRLYHKENLKLEDLQGELQVTGFDRGLPRYAVQRGGELGRYMHISSSNARRELVRKGLAYYVCALPPKAERDASDRRFVPLEDYCYRMVAVTNPQKPMQPEVVRFLELLKQQIAEDYPDL